MKNRKGLRIITIIGCWIIQGFILNHFFDSSNAELNDSESNAVLLLFATGTLLISTSALLILSLYLEEHPRWRWIFTLSFSLLPVVWIILLLITGNPLYFYSS